jgi:hypothetical protein
MKAPSLIVLEILLNLIFSNDSYATTLSFSSQQLKDGYWLLM